MKFLVTTVSLRKKMLFFLLVLSVAGCKKTETTVLPPVKVNVITAIFSFMQDFQAQRAMEGFAKMVPLMAVVVRDSHIQSVEATSLVVGDIVQIKSGNSVPADIRIVEANGLRVDNSSLTGESEPQVWKTMFFIFVNIK